MRKLSHFWLFAISGLATTAMAEVAAPPSATGPSHHQSLADLQSRFAKLQQVVRSNNEPFDLQLVGDGETLLGQRRDGVIRLPENWVEAAPDRGTLDFLMLLALSDAATREPTREPARERPSAITRAVTNAIVFIAVNAAKNAAGSASRDLYLQPPSSPSIRSQGKPDTALRALGWAVASGSCEARIVAGLRRLETVAGAIGVASRQIVKDLGAVAWTPNDRCSPPGN